MNLKFLAHAGCLTARLTGEIDGEVDGFFFCDGEVDGELDGEVDGPSKCPSRCPLRQNKAYFIMPYFDKISLVSSKISLVLSK